MYRYVHVYLHTSKYSHVGCSTICRTRERWRETVGSVRLVVTYPSLSPSSAARYLEKKTRRFLNFFRAPPLPVSPGSPEVDLMIDPNRRSG